MDEQSGESEEEEVMGERIGESEMEELVQYQNEVDEEIGLQMYPTRTDRQTHRPRCRRHL